MSTLDVARAELALAVLYLNKAEARDKICRAIQYGSKFLSNGEPGTAQNVDKSTSLARKVFRLFKVRIGCSSSNIYNYGMPSILYFVILFYLFTYIYIYSNSAFVIFVYTYPGWQFFSERGHSFEECRAFYFVDPVPCVYSLSMTCILLSAQMLLAPHSPSFCWERYKTLKHTFLKISSLDSELY